MTKPPKWPPRGSPAPRFASTCRLWARRPWVFRQLLPCLLTTDVLTVILDFRWDGITFMALVSPIGQPLSGFAAVAARCIDSFIPAPKDRTSLFLSPHRVPQPTRICRAWSFAFPSRSGRMRVPLTGALTAARLDRSASMRRPPLRFVRVAARRVSPEDAHG